MASSPSRAAQEAAAAPTSQHSAGAAVTASTVAGSTNSSSTMTVESADVVRLIESYLTENGLHHSCTSLREESGIFGAGVSHRLFQLWARQGKWGTILESLSTMDESYMTATTDGENAGNTRRALLADVHEMAILELGDVGETELAYAALRLVADELDRTSTSSKEYNDNNHDGGILRIPRSRLLEQKLAALASYRASSASDEQRRTTTPPDYYAVGGGGSTNVMTQQARREEIGKRLADSIPVVPSSRLVTLLQQAIKWQAHTGLLPTKIQQQLKEEDEEEENEKDDKKKKKKKHKKRKRKEFNLVLGEVDVPSSVVGDQTTASTAEGETEAAISHYAAEPIPCKTYSTIKFGKKATAESTLFLPDSSGLVTGSSDGLIEIWESSQKYAKLQRSPFQEKDEFMWHDHPVLALAVSNDGQMLASGDLQGTVKVWKIESGTCLREFRAHEKSSISSLCFSNDGSRVLTASHDNTCREFGLRTSHMLKEFRGHTSYVNVCCYHLGGGGNGDNDRLYVITASADGTMRVWDGKTAETLKVLMPRDGVSSAIIDSSSAVGGGESGGGDISGGGPSIHSLIPLHKVPNGFLVVPRGPKAFIVTLDGTIIKSFDTGEGKVIIAATVSPSNLWFYAVTEDGVCFVFDLVSGKIEQSLRNFSLESTYNSSSHTKQQDGNAPAPPEISTIIHHPHKGILATFSNDKGQKRGLLTLWK